MRRDLVVFFLLAFALSWLVGWPLAAASRGWVPFRLHPALHVLVVAGPALAALLVARPRRAFLREALRPRWGWAALAVAAPFAVVLASAAVVRADVDWALLAAAPVMILVFGLGEEVGWRGFALPRLEERLSPRAATLALAVLWAAWHLPLIVDADAIGKDGAAGVARFLGSMLAGAFILTWLRHRSGSALACVLFHGALNAASTMVDDPLVSLVAAVLLVAGGAALWTWSPLFAARGTPPPAAAPDGRPG